MGTQVCGFLEMMEYGLVNSSSGAGRSAAAHILMLVGRVGFEPTTLCLKGRYSTD